MSVDADQQREADVQMKTLTVALSGAVAVVAHIDSNILHVASTGDCTAVFGTLSENDTWIPTKLTNEHNSDNKTEVKRIVDEHPGENPKHIIKESHWFIISVSCSQSNHAVMFHL